MCGIAGKFCWNNVENAEYNNIKKINLHLTIEVLILVV